LGLFAPERGTFKIDDMEINDGNIKSWQANLGYVPQQIYLSDDTIARNIAFGLPDEKIDMDQVKRVAQMANLDDFVENELSSGYNTIIGERGIRLSGGQRQRIGIARALYHDPQVLLFDEATSSLDNATEKEVLNAIEGIAKLKTMIVVAHRLTTVKNCDKVYVVEKGRIIKEGSYEEVVGNK
jgi:ABC-type multidrug transport system fused ATPase/permease subunit